MFSALKQGSPFYILNKNKEVSGFMLYAYPSLLDENAAAEIKNLREAIR